MPYSSCMCIYLNNQKILSTMQNNIRFFAGTSVFVNMHMVPIKKINSTINFSFSCINLFIYKPNSYLCLNKNVVLSSNNIILKQFYIVQLVR